MGNTRAFHEVLTNYSGSSRDGYAVPSPLNKVGSSKFLNPHQPEQKFIISLIIIALIINKVDFYTSVLLLVFCQCT